MVSGSDQTRGTGDRQARGRGDGHARVGGQEREIKAPVDLCASDGRLNPAAVGWSRSPLIRADVRGWGRRKRWEYWAVQSRDAVFSLTVSDLDYAGLYAVWFLDPSQREAGAGAVVPVPRLRMPVEAGGGEVTVHTKALSIGIRPTPDGIRLRAETQALQADIEVTRPPAHEAMGVVVPWSSQRFQYTVKENTLPARGTVTVDGQPYEFGEDAWATWDFGRGKWPYRITWNWASGSGMVGDHLVGLQFGGKWTEGTGSTENAVMIDGTCHKISAELDWDYDPTDWLAPWRLHAPDGSVDLTLRPRFDRADTTEFGIIGNRTHQVFGTWHGTVSLPGTPTLQVDGLQGWAEEVRNRW